MEKKQIYENLLVQLRGLVDGEHHPVSVMANATALLRELMGERFFWTGFYVVDGEQLVLGPFQGSTACYRIGRGRGVCGAAWQQAQTLVVPDVEAFPGHIACSSLSRSEIVVPLLDSTGTVRAVLDIDSRDADAFDSVDAHYLEQVARMIAAAIY